MRVITWSPFQKKLQISTYLMNAFASTVCPARVTFNEFGRDIFIMQFLVDFVAFIVVVIVHVFSTVGTEETLDAALLLPFWLLFLVLLELLLHLFELSLPNRAPHGVFDLVLPIIVPNLEFPIGYSLLKGNKVTRCETIFTNIHFIINTLFYSINLLVYLILTKFELSVALS